MNDIFLFVDMLSCYEDTRFWLTAGRPNVDKIWGFFRQIFGGGIKNIRR